MDFSSLFSGVDNLFKFLFLGGLVMILVSIFYPLQKSQELELVLNSHNKEVALLNKDITSLKGEVEKLKAITSTTLDSLYKLDSLKVHARNPDKVKLIAKRIKGIQVQYNQTFAIAKNRQRQVEIKSIILEYDQKKVKVLENHANTFKSYSYWFLVIGILLGSIGLILWSWSTFNTEYLKKYELEAKRKELAANTQQASSSPNTSSSSTGSSAAPSSNRP